LAAIPSPSRRGCERQGADVSNGVADDRYSEAQWLRLVYRALGVPDAIHSKREAAQAAVQAELEEGAWKGPEEPEEAESDVVVDQRRPAVELVVPDYLLALGVAGRLDRILLRTESIETFAEEAAGELRDHDPVRHDPPAAASATNSVQQDAEAARRARREVLGCALHKVRRWVQDHHFDPI
jgi:hypothetical protein